MGISYPESTSPAILNPEDIELNEWGGDGISGERLAFVMRMLVFI